VLPDADHGTSWDVIVDTAGNHVDGDSLAAGAACSVGAHTLLVLREHTRAAAGDAAVSATLAPATTVGTTASPTSTG
jgi:hypothetical protein